MTSILDRRISAVLTPQQALKAAVSPTDRPHSSLLGQIAEKYGFNYATFANCLNPTTPSHTPNIHHIVAVLAETKDMRILDSFCAVHGNAFCCELPEVDVGAFEYVALIGDLGKEMADLARSVSKSIKDGQIGTDEWAVIQKDVFDLMRITAQIYRIMESASKKS